MDEQFVNKLDEKKNCQKLIIRLLIVSEVLKKRRKLEFILKETKMHEEEIYHLIVRKKCVGNE